MTYKNTWPQIKGINTHTQLHGIASSFENGLLKCHRPSILPLCLLMLNPVT